MSTSHRRPWVSVAAAVVTAALFSSVPGWGQFRPARSGVAADDAAADKDSPVGVTIPESPGASELLAKGADKEKLAQWKSAADFYTDAVKQFSGRVVPDKNKDARRTDIFAFNGISREVQERIAKWPAGGLKVYDTAYDKTAADLLASAGPQDIGTVQAVFWDYFVTPAGKQAGIRLVDNYLEAGDYPAAAWVANRLLKIHPALGSDWGMLAYRAITANHYAGDDAAAVAVLSDLKSKGNQTGTIGGKDVLLADAADAVMAASVPVVTVDTGDSDTWPSYGGIGGRGQLAPTSARPGATLAYVRMTPPEFTVGQGLTRNMLVSQDTNSLKQYAGLGVMPVVDGGSMFFNDGRNIYAVDVDSGLPLPGWLNTYPGSRNGRYHITTQVPGRARGELLTVTVTPSQVMAVIGQPDRQTGNNPYANMQISSDGSIVSTTRLVCLDRSTGREMWTRTPADLPESAGTIRAGTYNGTPLVVPARFAGRAGTDEAQQAPEDSILVAVRGGKDNQFDDCYVVCLSARTGEYRWSTYVGSASRGWSDYAGVFDNQDPTQLALADGRVLVMSNLGTVCAMDPADGRLVWLAGYNREGANNQNAINQRRGGFRGGGEDAVAPQSVERPWSRNPIVVSGGKVFALPADSKNLFVFDAETGAELKRIATAGLELKTDTSSNQQTRGNTSLDPTVAADVLLGVRGDVVYLSSSRSVFALNWKNYDLTKPREALVAFRINLAAYADNSAGAANGLFGRGFLSQNALFITSNTHLYELDPDNLTVLSMYPEQGEFDKPGKDDKYLDKPGPGNVLATSQSVIVAGQKRVDSYMDIQLVRSKYEAQIAASPGDPDPHIRFAEALFAAGESAESLAQIDAAIDLVGGRTGMRPGPARAGIYSAVLDFAKRATENAGSAAATQGSGIPSKSDPRHGDPAALAAYTDALFERVTDAAYTPAERATARLERATFEHIRRGYVAEVNLCQEVLCDPEQRNAVWQDDLTGGQTAEAMIDVVKREQDKDPHPAYAAIEARAAAAHDQAGDDPEKLLAMAYLYPNSDAAKAARTTAVVTFENHRQIPRAIEILKQMYTKAAADHTAQADVLARVTADYLTMPDGVGPAIDRMAWAKRISSSGRVPRAIPLPDGTTLAEGMLYTEALVKLRALQTDAATAALPDFHIPANVDGKIKNPFVAGDPKVIPSVTTLVHPQNGFACNSQVLTWSGDGLRIYPVGQTKPLATVMAVTDSPIAAAHVHRESGDKWVVWTPTSVAQVSAADGSVDWNFKLASAPAIPVTPGTTTPDEIPANGDNGNVNQQNALQAQLQMQAINNPAFVAGQMRFRGGRIRNAGGMPGVAMIAPTPIVAGPEQIVTAQMAGDRLVASTSTGRIFAVELSGGKLAWQTRPSDKPADQFGANLAFGFGRFDDPAGAIVMIFDSASGRIMQRRKFAADGSQTGGQLVNVALSEEGTLAFTLVNKAEMLNLYDDLKLPAAALVPGRADNESFIGLNQPDQLTITGGRVLAMYNGGTYFRSFDVSKTNDISAVPLYTNSTGNAAWLRTLGSQVYVLGLSNWVRYNLVTGKADDGVPLPSESSFPERARGLFIGRDNVVVLDDPVDRGPAGSPFVDLLIYNKGVSRYFPVEVRPAVHTGQITEWLPVEGGFYYQTTDQKLHFLATAPTATPTTAPAN